MAGLPNLVLPGPRQKTKAFLILLMLLLLPVKPVRMVLPEEALRAAFFLSDDRPASKRSAGGSLTKK
jgi:hypothetical protein